MIHKRGVTETAAKNTKLFAVSERDVLLCSPKPQEQEVETQVEGNLAAEVSLIALDTLELIIQVLCHCLTVTVSHTQLAPPIPCESSSPALSWGPLSYSETHSSILMPYPSTAHPVLMGTIVMLLL